MFRNIQKNRKLLIISDTGMFQKNGRFFAFGPVVKEVEYFLEEFDTVTWIGYNKPNEEKNKSFIQCNNKRLNYIFFPSLGGKGWLNKLYTLSRYPIMFLKILIILFKHDKIHSRAPSHPAFITMLLSYFFKRKSFWFKYAGSWIDNASPFYEFQRKVLNKLGDNSKITVNGKWNHKKLNILAFENPCLNSKDRIHGKKIISEKLIQSPANFCFVGALNSHKGVYKILEALKGLNKANSINEFHFVGDGPHRKEFEKIANTLQLNIFFHGFLAKDAIRNIYSISDFIILPSKSEGFPKVIGEAMNFGCIPIVSDVSCVSQYIKNGVNGFLINPITSDEVLINISRALDLEKKEKVEIIKNNFKLAEKFTYSYYNNRIVNEIF